MIRFLSFNRNIKTIVVFIILFLVVSTALLVVWGKKYPLSLNGKNYRCSTLSKEDEKALKLNAELITNIQKIREDSIIKVYNEKINNCGTEKEYEASPGVEEKLKELIPSDIQAGLDEYHRTKTYTIKDFQKCRKNWEDAKKEDMNMWTTSFSTEIKRREVYEENLLTKNGCMLSRE